MSKRSVYPFTAIVGQERMKRALTLNAINPSIGGVLIRGERGTAKSTAARALAALLPEIEVVADSPFNDDPKRPDTWSDFVRDRSQRGETLPVTRRQIRLVELPVSATEDRVVGTLDIEKAIKQGERHFDPGVLAAANRGILYVDEVNLLDDHIVDLLLDSAAMGINVVEREGISFQHPARFILVGTMNPEEGDLRPQLLDRFALSVDVRGITEPRSRMAILQRHIEFDTNPNRFREQWQPEEDRLGREIENAREIVDNVRYTERDLFMIANLTASFKIDGHRADLVILKAARAQAALDGRTQINEMDIMMAAELALPHRVKRGPFDDTQLSAAQLQQRLEQVQSDWEGEEGQPQPSAEESQMKKKLTR
jgi:Mg-chelatase subunit ChlI